MSEEEKTNNPASSDLPQPDKSAEISEKQLNNGNKSKEDEDDVPGDFFDDFLKDDFMAGLDIVDEESEDPLKKKHEPKVIIIDRRLSSSVKKVYPKIDHVKKFRESPPDKSKIKPRSEEIKQEIRNLDAQLEKIRYKKPVKARLGGIEPEEFDAGHRRDPEKVRRDIQMDKQRCERRLITDIVETGLVPPGMELEVEFTTVHRQARVDKHPPPGDLREILRSRRSRSHDKKSYKKSRTPEKRKRSVTPKEKKRSPTPEKVKEKIEKVIKHRSPEPKQHSVKKDDERPEKVSPKKSPKPDKSPKHSKSVKSPSHKLSKSPRKTPPKRRRSHTPLIREVENLKSSVDEIIESHLESRRAKREKDRSPAHESSRRKSPVRRSSPLRRPPPRRLSPRRARSPMLRRVDSPSPRRSPSRRQRSLRRSRSRSPSYRRRRRDSRSPRRSRRSRSRSRPKREEKKSFLEELAEKLGHTQAQLLPPQLQQPYGHPMGGPYGPPGMLPGMPPGMSPGMPPGISMPHNGPPMAPQNMPMGMMPMMQQGPMGMMNTGPGILGPPPNVPNPVVPNNPTPAPQQTFFRPQGPPVIPQGPPVIPQGPPVMPQQPSTSTFDPYDQSFFIGNDPLPPNSFNSGSSQPLVSPVENKDMQNNSKSLEKIPPDLSKLFEDDKIKLSEFLAITAKPQGDSSSSAKLQEKIKVISQCQEAIKILHSNRRYVGPLVLERTNEQPQTSKQKYLSPLLKNPIVTLPFTSSVRKNNLNTANEYPKFCQGLLYKLGISKQLPIFNNREVEKELPKMPVRRESPEVEYVPVKKVQAPPVHIQFSQVPSRLRTLHQVTQTDPQLSACKECERRKEIDLINTGTQVGDSKMSFSVSTQVCESDFYSTIPKSQSLAQLTPAQLMGKQLRNLDGPGPSRGNDYSSRGGLYDEYAPSRSNYRGNFNPSEDIFPSNPPPPSLYNRSPSPTNTLFGGTRTSLSDTLRASLGSRFKAPRKY